MNYYECTQVPFRIGVVPFDQGLRVFPTFVSTSVIVRWREKDLALGGKLMSAPLVNKH